ncbi:MAG: hypothetical protein R2827_01655 [Bdellovibrionales bacterium]
MASGDVSRYNRLKQLIDVRTEQSNKTLLRSLIKSSATCKKAKVEANIAVLALNALHTRPCEGGHNKSLPGANGLSILEELSSMDRDPFSVAESRESYVEVVQEAEAEWAPSR